jgi:hypothetical protein
VLGTCFDSSAFDPWNPFSIPQVKSHVNVNSVFLPNISICRVDPSSFFRVGIDRQEYLAVERGES